MIAQAHTGAPQAGARPSPQTPPVQFPSVAWFARLADLMRLNRARQEQLGFVDCAVRFLVSDGLGAGAPCAVLVRFEEFEAVEVSECGAAGDERVDFTIEGPLAAWREMIENIAAGGGKPDLDHSLNRLTHFEAPLRVTSSDVLRKDLYFRFNQSLQEFVNASSAIRTEFGAV